MVEKHKSMCLLCSMGCGFIMEIRDGEPVNLEYDTEDTVGKGSLCSKGNYALELLNHPLRLSEPYAKGKTLLWNDAFNHITGTLKRVMEQSSAGLIISGDASTEDVLTAQLFSEKCLDGERFAVHFSTGDDTIHRALAGAHIPNSSATAADIEKSGCIIAVGNPFEVGPVIAGRVLGAKCGRRGNLFAVISKTRNTTSRFANVHLAGPERKTLVDLLRVMVDETGGNTPGWKNPVRETVPFPADPAVAGVAKKFRETPSAVLIVETQDTVTAQLAAAVVAAAGSDKHLYCLTTYGNAGGICDALKETVPVEALLDTVERGDTKALIVLGADIIRGLPGRDVMSVLKKADYIVAGAPFENSTTEAADIVLPTALWLETEGTYNGRLLRPVAEPPGGALSFGVILHQIAQYMGYILPPVSIGKVLPRVELNEETVKALVRAAEKDAPEPAVCSTPIVYGDGSITDNMQWIQLQERNAW